MFSFSSTDPPAAGFELLGDDTSFQNGVNASPFGYFDIGAGLGDDFEGGGKPQTGVISGQSVTFKFVLMGEGLDLTAADFLSTLSDPTGQGKVKGQGQGQETEDLVVRFRGFECAGRRMTPTRCRTRPSSPNPGPSCWWASASSASWPAGSRGGGPDVRGPPTRRAPSRARARSLRAALRP